MNNGQNVARSRHLEELARAAKQYTLQEILDVTEAVATELENLNDFTGATSIAGGLSGLVPAPQAGDNGKFLRGDGTWATVESGSSGGGIDYVIGSNVSTVEGGFWQDIINDTPVLKLRHGDYEYNFQYDDLTFLGGASSPLVTVTPDTYVLGTASVSSEGGVWYEVNNNVPQLKLHAGNYNYGFKYDSITYKGDSSHLVAYLPFDVSTTDDACGNIWTASGSLTITDGKLSLNGSSYLVNSNVADAIDANSWTIDCWATLINSRESCLLFHANNVLNAPGSNNSMVCLGVKYGIGGEVYFEYCNATKASSQTVDAGTRHHYAATYDGTTLRAFFDGNLVIEDTRQITLGGQFCIGRRNDNYFYWDGTIDHFRIHRTVLWTENFTPPTANDYL